MRAVDLLGGTEILSKYECLDLLRSESVGRVGVIVDDRVEIFPVNYEMDDETIVFGTNAGRKMHGVLTGSATFEVDRIDLKTQAGWSVVVHGRSEDISSSDAPTLDRAGHEVWTGPKDFLVRITPQSITGRRVIPPSFRV